MTHLKQFNFEQMVSEKEGKPVTTSFQIAEYFGKHHHHVLRDIKRLDCSAEFMKTNFGFCLKINDLQNGKKQGYYIISKDGFMFLVMGYRGKKAAELKENYIKAFNWMHEQLTNKAQSFMAAYNDLIMQFNQEKSVASFAGRSLRKWRDRKPILTSKIKQLEDMGQGRLLLS